VDERGQPRALPELKPVGWSDAQWAAIKRAWEERYGGRSRGSSRGATR
jgi:hypothetical protein